MSTHGTVRLRKVQRGWYDVRLDGVLIGRVRHNEDDGQWTAAVWTRCPPSFTARSLEPLAGGWNTRFAALQDLVAAWGDDNAA